MDIGVDPTSLARWQQQGHDPSEKYRQLLIRFIAGLRFKNSTHNSD